MKRCIAAQALRVPTQGPQFPDMLLQATRADFHAAHLRRSHPSTVLCGNRSHTNANAHVHSA